ncbi:DoxX family protein, partial [Nonomuraea rubra]|uniref:DoxX family protein n=1 Tax=Nonomuraea rubra TaxID=46180 RepID=UPI0031F09DBC
ALGLAAGLWLKPLAVAAAAGLTLLLIGAVGFHLRARDFAHRRHRSHAVGARGAGRGHRNKPWPCCSRLPERRAR